MPPHADRRLRLCLSAAVMVTASASSAHADTPANPLDADRAFGYLEQVCALGPRPSGSPAMERQIRLLTDHFQALGAEVTPQSFLAPHPLARRVSWAPDQVRMTNLIARFRPELTRRVVLCAHYDTRPLPDRDPNPTARRSGRFIGANDGGSGVAVLMELAHLMPRLTGDVGVDLVLFDGEELVYRERRDPYFLGSEHFAEQYKQRTEDYKYEWGVLLDMVGDKRLRIYYERNGWNLRQTRPLAKKLWETAARLRVGEFVPRAKHTVSDDHIALNAVGIPTVDLIDFDYPYWHTTQDVPENCSGESLAKVGWVVWEWLRELDAAGAKADTNAETAGAAIADGRGTAP